MADFIKVKIEGIIATFLFVINLNKNSFALVYNQS